MGRCPGTMAITTCQCQCQFNVSPASLNPFCCIFCVCRTLRHFASFIYLRFLREPLPCFFFYLLIYNLYMLGHTVRIRNIWQCEAQGTMLSSSSSSSLASLFGFGRIWIVSLSLPAPQSHQSFVAAFVCK